MKILYTSEKPRADVNFPALIYDDMCASCTAYARIVNKLVNGKITMVGHHSKAGKEFKNKIFPQGYKGLEMSWFVTPDTAYGGSKGLRKLLGYIFSLNRFADKQNFQKNEFDYSRCSSDCKSVHGVMFRSQSILREGKTIPIKTQGNSTQKQ